ncbi:hypothetical protein C922_04227 [Plasmodium inui San Antonio 1]|uniref:Uncharacterized protein n=1 Tax=Plasmodium inui San Antonio 1 TaxID=1237626 RepID=W6ZXF9_9APIC|nr:hypothetical protein C922_04227 [Plasmodium inui San Antonio 1]EUD65487.1 hypothetical protein C922_04227 [Plasmodium inui San Antonio 1]
MTFKFSEYLSDLTKKVSRSPQAKEAGVYKLRLWEILKPAAGGSSKVGGERWDNISTRGHIQLKDTALRAKLICKTLESWVSNQEAPGTLPQEKKQGECQLNQLGWINGKRNEITCPYQDNYEVWTTRGKGEELYLSQQADRTLLVCMDMVSIILTAFQNVVRKQDGWALDRGQDVCQYMYERLEEWSNDSIAKELMELWFQATETETIRNNFPVNLSPKRDEQWQYLFRSVGSLVHGMQCSKDTKKANSYYVSCLAWKDGNGCDVGQDDEGREAEQVSNGRATTERIL